jgi:hypothetical protein
MDNHPAKFLIDLVRIIQVVYALMNAILAAYLLPFVFHKIISHGATH